MIHIKLTIMALLWAGGFISGKFITYEAGPFTIAFLRFLIATIVLGAFVYKRDKPSTIDLTIFGKALGAAFIGIFCYNYLFFSGIKYVDAARGSVIVSTVPIVVAILSVILFNEKMGPIKILGILFSLVGAWIVISKGHLESFNIESLGKGEWLLMGCVLSAAIFTILSKEVLQNLSPLVAMVYISALGTVFVMGPAFMEMSQTPVNFMSLRFSTNLLYLALGPSVFAGLFYHEAITQVGVSRASQYMNLMPVFAVILAIIFLDEQMTSSLLVGGGLVTTGLYLTNFNS